jgi:hypothetical protein
VLPSLFNWVTRNYFAKKAAEITNKDNTNIKPQMIIIGVKIPSIGQSEMLKPMNDINELKLAI